MKKLKEFTSFDWFIIAGALMNALVISYLIIYWLLH